MLHRRRVFGLFLATLFTGCALMNPYARTAKTLSSAYFYWAPAEMDSKRLPTAEEEARANADLQQCITRLFERSRSVGRMPETELRVLEIQACMNQKHWVLLQDYVIVTS